MTPDPSLAEITSRLELIEARNRRVEADKAWETSWVRRLLICGLTYVTIATYLEFVVRISPWVNAVVPTASFLISTMALGLVKSAWVRRRESRLARR